MPQAAKGLYAPRIVDVTFAAMGLGSAALLASGSEIANTLVTPNASAPFSGLFLLGTVILIAISSCLVHQIDRKGWDDYMGQVVTQSAMIAVITTILAAVAFDFLIAPAFGLSLPQMMIQGVLPIICGAWAIGYFFLRWKGTTA